MAKTNPASRLHAYFFIITGIFLLGVYLPENYITTPISIGPGIVFATIAIFAGLLILWQREYFVANRTFTNNLHLFVYIVLIVLTLRTFIVEPTRISSNSMLPSLQIGDYIFIEKFSFGFSLPFTKKKLFTGSVPSRGSILVYKDATDSNRYYIKRLIGLPGDKITYNNNVLVINEREVETKSDGVFNYIDKRNIVVRVKRAIEYLGTTPYPILDGALTLHAKNSVWRVPPDHYFFLGDNRDDSNDSRFLGFVASKNLIGRPFRY